MLRQIISIAGRPGLFKIISQNPKLIIVEDLISHKRTPAHQRDKIISVGDVAMYTLGEDLPIDEILTRLYKNMEGKQVDIKQLTADNDGLPEKFAEIVPDFDRDRVYNSDIKKLFTWYNILVQAGFTTFKEEEETPQEETPQES